MGVADHTFDVGMIESALSRASGVLLDSYAYGPETNPDPTAGFRKYRNRKEKTGVGHTYLHVEGPSDAGGVSGRMDKSRFADRQTLIQTLVAAFGVSNGDAQKGLQWLDANPGKECWLKKVKVRDLGTWYGHEPGSTTKKKVEFISINMRSHGDALFISSAYPAKLGAVFVPPTSTLNPNAKAFVPGGG